MNKTEAITQILAATAEQPIIFTTGYACRIAQDLDDRPSHLYMTGSMGLASSIGTGVALATGCPTVVVDGDGSLLMNPVGLLTAGGFEDLPLLHIVLADGCYASTGGQPVPAPRADFCALATASGYARVVASEELSTFSALVRAAVAECRSPTFILAVLNEPDAPVPARIDVDLGAHARRFQAHLAGIQQAGRGQAAGPGPHGRLGVGRPV